MSIDNEPRPGRPRTSTYERSVNLLADALEEDHRATCEELSRDTRAKSSEENAQERTSISRGWVTQKNSWHYSSEEPRPTEAVAAIWQYRTPFG